MSGFRFKPETPASKALQTLLAFIKTKTSREAYERFERDTAALHRSGSVEDLLKVACSVAYDGLQWGNWPGAVVEMMRPK